MKTKGLSPKIIGPVAAALSAFATAKIHDPATSALVVALIGATALWLSPPGELTVEGIQEALDPDFGEVDDVIADDAPVAPDMPRAGARAPGRARRGAASAARDIQLARKANSHGAKYSLRIIREARRANIPISLGFSLVQHETGFRNVFGHDPTIYVGAGAVTKRKYLAYKRRRGKRGQGGMQGVGPCQLTWWEFQDGADRLGGCWNPRHNIRRAFNDLAAMIRAHGYAKGVERYNGVGQAARQYSMRVRVGAQTWHRRLT